MQTLKKNNINGEAYTLKLKSIADNLVAIGEEVTSKYLIPYGLCGLDSDYKSFVSLISVLMRINKVQFSDFQSKVISFEIRFMNQRSHGDVYHSMQANVARFKYSGSKSYGSSSSNTYAWNIQDFLQKSNSN